MNKTVNINIGGLIFHIDENAFQKLSRYFDAIRKSLSNSSGQEEFGFIFVLFLFSLGPQLYFSDPSGTYLEYKAKAIGAGSEGNKYKYNFNNRLYK